ncbi:MAG: hypothetical protein A2651_01075 [Candidatus Yanofskybacteria bacterium RIFCSPHIGHO2_01_FULL_42_12]|uniref:Uncharacterized protein n=1 Tax=Candidatus Yanofskybacteria bacterium RIFCSPLOWO2_01_FULL_42_49 TaxID=1802694 RepID=A0A1F8GDX4_9BACT|nr:MAG: hypothetical protein A2651_01075 [Candidatus Yanofskybacteria bacterium RIFCSPHIGHO2_01_FULL_42_12]OGN22659.1 MAG: hypothetical protein A2918_00975 [Candidatus Yanofskybacteria bacterium RIFCSPLOWO2_01_FULL_42_49]
MFKLSKRDVVIILPYILEQPSISAETLLDYLMKQKGLHIEGNAATELINAIREYQKSIRSYT